MQHHALDLVPDVSGLDGMDLPNSAFVQRLNASIFHRLLSDICPHLRTKVDVAVYC